MHVWKRYTCLISGCQAVNRHRSTKLKRTLNNFMSPHICSPLNARLHQNLRLGRSKWVARPIKTRCICKLERHTPLFTQLLQKHLKDQDVNLIINWLVQHSGYAVPPPPRLLKFKYMAMVIKLTVKKGDHCLTKQQMWNSYHRLTTCFSTPHCGLLCKCWPAHETWQKSWLIIPFLVSHHWL